MSVLPLQRDVYYPESDGKPLGETEAHIVELAELLAALRAHFQDDPNVWVGGNQFLYPIEGQPRIAICPDLMVTVGIPKTPARRVYKLWEEGRPPSLVLEITSDSTREEDLSSKKASYERIGVEEYFLHDPLSEYLKPPLQGFRLAEGRYRPIEPEPDGGLLSRTAGLKLKSEGERLRLFDTRTGEPLLFPGEERAARQAAEDRVRTLEEELARLRRELDRH